MDIETIEHEIKILSSLPGGSRSRRETIELLKRRKLEIEIKERKEKIEAVVIA